MVRKKGKCVDCQHFSSHTGYLRKVLQFNNEGKMKLKKHECDSIITMLELKSHKIHPIEEINAVRGQALAELQVWKVSSFRHSA